MTKNISAKWAIKLGYAIPLTIFLALLVDSFDKWGSKSSFGFTYLQLFGFAIVVFGYQLIRNSIVGWGTVVFLYFTYMFYFIEELKSTWNMIGIKFDNEYFTQGVFMLVIYLLVGYFYFLIRPTVRLI